MSPGKEPVVILIREEVKQGNPLSIIIYGINLTPLVEELRVADPKLLALFNANDAAFDGLTG